MFWIGGNPGSGKSTIARQLAHELDLPLHPIDAFVLAIIALLFLSRHRVVSISRAA